MEPTDSFENGYQSFYLPHHSVLKPESRSTKVRVVFNASKKTTSGLSLNDILHVGPTLQLDLMTLILKWRLYKYVFNGDIEKFIAKFLFMTNIPNFRELFFDKIKTDPFRIFH